MLYCQISTTGKGKQDKPLWRTITHFLDNIEEKQKQKHYFSQQSNTQVY